ncbi:hypothetical protein K437DRAFT_292434 [Tilletiaria anomala UBC 951]|uniref:TPR-like protein n=1 Tax=Tilletiaria anomala (strain ATCC 24038 / CBS 436.72 / UBC 951) TaxID=1037660 RepID=A0A066WGW5_TILAU|nr:uncharacterized protein K437DRAFT_292434 [Tilletiaria anomala UBC 951]KDN53237.1 hypothetical protein K437DRAFT_292434 [Tilletiaria anomala UBC 951]
MRCEKICAMSEDVDERPSPSKLAVPPTLDASLQTPLSAGQSFQRADASSLLEDGDELAVQMTQEDAAPSKSVNLAPAFIGAPCDDPSAQSTSSIQADEPPAAGSANIGRTSTVPSVDQLYDRGTQRANPLELPGISVPALAHPSLFMELPTSDAIGALLAKHIAPNLRPSRDLSGRWPPGEIASLPTAIHTNSWRRVAQSARSHIIAFGAAMMEGRGGAAEILVWWNVRLHALWRLRLHAQVSREIEALWGVLENTVISSDASAPSPEQPDGLEGQRTRPQQRTLVDSPIVPFALQVLRAKQPRLHGEHAIALDRCSALLRKCQGTARRFATAAEKCEGDARTTCQKCQVMWNDRASRVTLITASLLVEIKDYRSAINVLAPLLSSASPASQDPYFLSGIGRMYLQCGMLQFARQTFQRCSKVAQDSLSKVDTVPPRLMEEDSAAAPAMKRATQLRAMLATDQALLHVAHGEFKQAEEALRPLFPSDWRLAGQHNLDLANQLSNLAVILFYQGQLEEPVEMLETLLRDGPSAISTTDSLIFNLVTFHELGRDDSIMDKRRILLEVAQWAGEGISTSALKLA